MSSENSGTPLKQNKSISESHRNGMSVAHIFPRLILIMVSIFLITLIATALFTGGPAYLSKIIKNLITPNVPKLSLQVGDQEKKIAAMPNDLAVDIFNQLTLISDSSIAKAALEIKEVSPIMNILNKTTYKPIQMTALQAPKQLVTFNKEPSQIKLFIHFNGKDTISDSLATLQELNPPIDGPCYVLLEVYWAADKAWQTPRHGLYSFVINFDRPAQFELNSTELNPGELLVIYARNLTKDDKVDLVSDLPLSLRFAPFSSQEMVALVPLSYDLPAGKYNTTITVNQISHDFIITIKDKEFPIYNTTNDAGVIDAACNESKQEFNEQVLPILKEQGSALLWSGTTQIPVENSKLITLFGVRSYINDDAISSRHTGIDLQAPQDSLVMAVNAGKVIFSDELTHTGNTIIIEHGLGLKSWYYHLTERTVKVGEEINKGQIIGKLGNTGNAKEPHLHFNLSVNETYINPETAFYAPLFTSK